MAYLSESWLCKCGRVKSEKPLQYCDTCHVAFGGKLCVCGKQILRGDSWCRDCWSAKMAGRLRTFRELDDQDEEMQDAMSAEDGRMTLLNLELMEGGRWWRDCLSDEAKAGLEAWLEGKA